MAQKNITLGLVAHVDSGKTTLTEAMLVGGRGAAAGRAGRPWRCFLGHPCPGAQPGDHHLCQGGKADPSPYCP